LAVRLGDDTIFASPIDSVSATDEASSHLSGKGTVRHVARQTIDGSFHEVRVLSIAITADAAARQFIGQVTDAKRPSVTKSNGHR
jgi:hypothetical protein